jgi:chorismate mutase
MRPWPWLAGLGLWIAVAAASGCHHALDAHDTRLIELMAQRLDVSRDVAWTKFNSGAPVLDPPREQVVLTALVGQATRAGVGREAAERFFTAQIAASRQVQTEWIDGWKNGRPRPATPPLDLANAIRPRLDGIGEQMVAALAARFVRPANDLSTRAKVALEAKGFSQAAAAIAAGGLAGGVANETVTRR